MSDTDHFSILYTLLYGEAETIYNRHVAETDKTKALRCVWRALKMAYGYRDEAILSDLTERSVRPPVQSTSKGLFWSTLTIVRRGPETNTKWHWITQAF